MTNSSSELKLSKKIAQGGMGEVWLGELVGPGSFRKPVAVKKIFSGDSGSLIAEATASARLVHPNIVQVYDIRVEESSLNIIMEFVDGITIDELFNVLRSQHAQLSIDVAIHILYEALLALDFAHSANLVHRDISPDNIMVSRQGVVKLLDFGIARNCDTALSSTKTGTVRGKLSYMAPERVDGAPATYGSDLYSLGVVVFELLTLSRLFDAKTTQELLKQIATSKAPSLRSVRTDIPVWLSDIIGAMVNPAPSARPISARHIIDTILQQKIVDSRQKLASLLESLSRKKATKGTLQNTTVLKRVNRDNFQNSRLLLIALTVLVLVIGVVASYNLLPKKHFPLELRVRVGSRIFDFSPPTNQLEMADRSTSITEGPCSQLFYDELDWLSVLWSKSQIENMMRTSNLAQFRVFLPKYLDLLATNGKRFAALRKTCLESTNLKNANELFLSMSAALSNLNVKDFDSPEKLASTLQQRLPFNKTYTDLHNLTTENMLSPGLGQLSAAESIKAKNTRSVSLMKPPGLMLYISESTDAPPNQFMCRDMIQRTWLNNLWRLTSEKYHEPVRILIIFEGRFLLDSTSENAVQFSTNTDSLDESFLQPLCYGEITNDIVKMSILWKPDYSREMR